MKRIPSRSLVYDISNLLFRVASMQKAKNPYAKECTAEELVGLCMHISLQSIYKWYVKFKPDFVVFAFEGGNNWRKTFTQKARSRKQYKGNRVIDPEMAHFYTLINSFKTAITKHTSICCLCVDTMEADDAIAGYCQLYASPEHEILIVSGDRDFTQLTKLPGVRLINPDNGKARNQQGDKDYEPDIDYWLFEKCVRGDMGDYVPSAFPRVRSTRIRAAYNNDYERINMMNETWSDEDGVQHRVGDLFEENVKLLDLYKQPPEIRALLEEGVKAQVEQLGNYNHFHFLRFTSEYQLEKVQSEAIKFVELFSNNQRFLKGERVNQVQLKPAQVVDPETVTTNLLQF